MFDKKEGTKISSDQKTMGKLKREVEKAKRTLSSQMSTRIEIESFHKGKDFAGEVLQIINELTRST